MQMKETGLSKEWMTHLGSQGFYLRAISRMAVKRDGRKQTALDKYPSIKRGRIEYKADHNFAVAAVRRSSNDPHQTQRLSCWKAQIRHSMHWGSLA